MLLVWTFSDPVFTDMEVRSVTAMSSVYLIGPNSFSVFSLFCLLRNADWRHWLWLLSLPLYLRHLQLVWTREERALDPALPLLVMATFLLSLLTGFGFCAFLL